MKVVVRVTMALVALSAFVLSFQSLTTLGEFAGYGVLAPLYPVTVDLGTVSSCAAWMATRSRQAFWMTWCFLSVSIVQNGVVHWLLATGQRPEWWLITLVATVPPATLGLVVHLGVSLSGHTAAPQVDAGAPGGAPAGAGDSPQTIEADLPQPDPDPVAELIAQGVGRRRIAQVAGVSEHVARRMIEERR